MAGFMKLGAGPIEDYTVGEFFVTRNRDDLFKINRYLQWMLEKRCRSDAPVWEREAALDKIFEEPMDWSLWGDAGSPLAFALS